MLLAVVSEQTLYKTQVNALCTCTYFAMLHIHNIKQPLTLYYTSQDITLCVCEPASIYIYITEFVRNVLYMHEQTIIIMLFFLAHKKLPGTRLTHPLPLGAMHPWANVHV